MSGTSESLNDMRERIEADKRSILEHVLNENSINSNNLGDDHKSISDAVYSLIFTKEDVDDSDEVFKAILKKAEKAYKQDKEFKKNNPRLKNILDNFKKPATKTMRIRNNKKSKVIEDSLKIMNNFRRNLIKKKVPKKTFSYDSIISAKNKRNKSMKKSLIATEGKQEFEIHPEWRTTEINTPIFSPSRDLRWAKNDVLPEVNKMYTPNQIYNWVETTKPQVNIPLSNQNTRSNATTYNSIIDNENFVSPIKNVTDPIIPIRSTTVRFKPSSPEYFPYSDCEVSSISSNFPLIKESAQNEHDNDIDNAYSSYEKDNYAGMDQDYLDENYADNFIKNSKKQNDYKENINKNYFSNNNETSNETNGSCSKSFSKQPLFEDFIRNLNNSISNNYNMEVKCSMKFKLFQ